MEERCFCGDNSNQGIVKENCPSTFLNRLVMKGRGGEEAPCVDLPSLKCIEGKDECFQDIGSVSLESTDVC